MIRQRPACSFSLRNAFPMTTRRKEEFGVGRGQRRLGVSRSSRLLRDRIERNPPWVETHNKSAKNLGLSASLLPFVTCAFAHVMLPVGLPAIGSVGHKSAGL